MVMLILTAETDPDGTVQINGDKSKKRLEKGDPPTEFRFKLVNQTKPRQTVEFSSLDTQDSVPCPPSSGLNSTQIPRAQVEIDPDTASFVNLNDNKDPMDVAYQWNFHCADGQRPTFDPIIDNRGRI
jgi:hypothetical protein